MNKSYHWTVVPTKLPTVLRNCPKCGRQTEYINSGNFRVNANQSRLDVWLIYRCENCNSTWNMEIHSRVNNKDIPKELYHKYLSNDKELAWQYAFDLAAHNRNKSVLNFNNVEYDILGDKFFLSVLTDKIAVEIRCKYPTDLRLDKILSCQLQSSRETIKKMIKLGLIYGEGIKDIGKAKVKDGIKLTLKGIPNPMITEKSFSCKAHCYYHDSKPIY